MRSKDESPWDHHSTDVWHLSVSDSRGAALTMVHGGQVNRAEMSGESPRDWA